MKEQTQDFQPTPASEALAHASQGLRDAYQKKILVIAPSAAQLAFIKRAFDPNVWIIDHAQFVEDAIGHFAEEPNDIVIADLAVCDSEHTRIRSGDLIDQLCEVNPNAMIIALSSEDPFIHSEVHKGIWELIVSTSTAETLKTLQDAVHNAWKTRLNRAELELGQRVKVIELMNYETAASREYGLRHACHDLEGEITEIRQVSNELEKSYSLDPALHELVEKIKEGVARIDRTIDRVRNLCSESDHKQNSIRL